jgi:outer membrane receptor for ferrienterochelin and colicins
LAIVDNVTCDRSCAPESTPEWALRRCRARRPAAPAVLVLALLFPATGAAQPAAPAQNIEDFSLEDMLNGPQLEESVTLSTKTQQRAAQTPAVVTVVTGAEIQARGYANLAEVLRAVPGFYDVYDLVSHNVGVRGINGGPRAAGNVIKLMIDGHPVDYRPTTGNYFGEELIPLAAVERVEIIRGPASAIYGANAFLGVVNVVTTTGKDLDGARLLLRGSMLRQNPGGGLGLMLGQSSGAVDVMIAAHLQHLDRSGLGLPAGSPDPAGADGRGPSQGDVARPMSAVAKLTLRDVLHGTLTLAGSLQRLDASGEFQDFSALTHATRVSNLNQNYRLAYEVFPSDATSLRLSAHHFDARPTAAERLDIGRPEFVLVRDVGASGLGATVDGQVRLHRRLALTGGLDGVTERHRLQTFSQLYRQDVLNPDGSTRIKQGASSPVDLASAQRTFRSFGAFLQAMLSLDDAWDITGGVRVDLHDLYGARPNGRLGVVYAPPASRLSLKLLYGSSFKSPSAEQLYTQPMKILDIQGNARLAPQTAHTFELYAGFGLPGDRGEVSLNGFVTDVSGRVEYAQVARFQTALNIDQERIVGGEVEARFALARPLWIRLSSGIAHTVNKRLGAAIPPGSPEVVSSLFPRLQSHLIVDYHLPIWEGNAALEVSHIGARPSSQSNALNRGQPYQVPGYLYLGLSLATGGRKILGDRETSFALRISDLANRRWVEPGFGGIDVPALGRSVFLTVIQKL